MRKSGRGPQQLVAKVQVEWLMLRVNLQATVLVLLCDSAASRYHEVQVSSTFIYLQGEGPHWMPSTT